MKVFRRTGCLSGVSDMTAKSVIMNWNLFMIKDLDIILVVTEIISSSVIS